MSRSTPVMVLRTAALGTLVLAGCVVARTDAPADAAIEATMRRYMEASNRGDAAALAALYADDAMLLAPEHAPIRGRAAIEAFWREGMEPGLAMETLRLEVEGRRGYLVGRYLLPATGEEPADSGKYVVLFERQPGGQWKITADIWNTDSAGDGPDGTDARPQARIT